MPFSSAWADDYTDAIAVFKGAGESSDFFKKAYGYAVFPSIGKGGIGVGAAHGTGHVYAGGKLVGESKMNQVSVGLQLGGSYCLVLSSYVDSELSRLGPGRTHLHELLRHAIDKGMRMFDFTVGDEPYKRDWSDKEMKLYDHLAAVTLRGRLVVAAVLAFRKTKRVIKRTPLLWRALRSESAFMPPAA
jgi:CelD/BcsL family acetyltransferase involved in cellulose biosynthesis